MMKIASFLLMAITLFSCAKENNSLPPDSDSTAVNTLDTGLVAYYPFSGNAKDSSVYKNHASVNTATSTVDRFGKLNRAYYFNGVNSYIQVPFSQSVNLVNDFTVSAWIRPEFVIPSYGDKTCIIGFGDTQSGLDPYFFYYHVFGNYVHLGTDRFNNYRDSLNAPDQRFLNVWTHVTGSWNFTTATLKIYINGQLASVRAFPQDTKVINYSTTGFVLDIGSAYGRYSMYKGAIDEVRVYNREITAEEAARLVLQ